MRARTLFLLPLLILLGCTVAPGPNGPDAGPSSAPVAKSCVMGGCSGQLCIEEGDEGISTCEWREEYACYRTATCERQPSGACGWTQTTELARCLQSAASDDSPIQ